MSTVGSVVALARDRNLTFLAAGIAYYAFVSTIPLLLLAVTIASFVGGQALADRVASMLSQQLSSSGQQMVSQALTNPSGRAAASVVGFFGVVWSALKLFRGLDQAFDEIYADEVDVSLLGQVWDGIVVIVGIALSVALVVAVGAALSILNLQIPFANVLGSLVLIVVLAIAFLPIYYVLPPMDVSVRSVLPGTIVAAIGWVLLQIGFRIYAANAGKYAAYGVIGAVLLFVTWLYFGSIVILLGAAVNAVRRGATAGTT
ncbi:ribonuclease BN [Haloterrigena turkmenica DSM 5511]|uniref:Ribonuclease BN n=1 Tax=Haloterrigena turkmenica (strain ATCC 51198 / DSM 5511 / JCM 9101 / NCIMB 13204 / VKM B-1734 / 4k) TaxID=543526 RepID=D2RZM6_HALTV|nr:YihY/virulence factor BrkB family protein [Haloterrigena turkmenica]ADB62065.1 ribonuclease BN [Haloterrigena turkmenica DSM 5511]